MSISQVLAPLWNSVPEELRMPIDILRRRYYWRASSVIFIHVPKAAGVSVSRAIYGRPLGHFYAKEIRRFCPYDYERLFTFAVVRHPLDRLRSAYRFACKGGTAEMGMRNPKLYQTACFATFDKFVCEWLVNQDMSSIDGVFRPQHMYVCDQDEIIVDKLVKLEHLDEGIAEVSAKLGREIILGRHNVSAAGLQARESEESLAIIEQVYRKDFEILSYA